MGGMTDCLPRNVFDSCVKSWHCFHTDKILLETSFYWLSDDTVRFKIEMGVSEKCTNTFKNRLDKFWEHQGVGPIIVPT